MSDHKNTPVAEIEADSKTVNVPVTAIIALVLAAIAFAISAYQFMGKGKAEVHTVDLMEITRIYQEQARNQGLREGITPEQQGAILEQLQKRMTLLQSVIDQYAADCQCNVYVKSAIVGRHNTIDASKTITDMVERQLPSAPKTQTVPEADAMIGKGSKVE